MLLQKNYQVIGKKEMTTTKISAAYATKMLKTEDMNNFCTLLVITSSIGTASRPGSV